MTNGNIKILIVDDEINSVEVMMNSFKGKPFQILYAPNGQRGYEVSIKERPDLIIMDWAMPVMNGLETTIKLRANEETKDIPVIISTGVMTTADDLIKAFETDALDYIRKPIDPREFLARINSALQRTKHLKEIKEKNEEIKRLSILEKNILNEELDLKERELSIQAILTREKYQLLNEILDDITILANEYKLKKTKTYKELEKKILRNLDSEGADKKFLIHFEKVNPSFFINLENRTTELTPNELKICAYIKLGMKNKEIAKLFGIELGTIKSNINRLKKKVKILPKESLRKFIQSV